MFAAAGDGPGGAGNVVGAAQSRNDVQAGNLKAQSRGVLGVGAGLQVREVAESRAGAHQGGSSFGGVDGVRLDQALLHPSVHLLGQVLILIGLIEVHDGGISGHISQNAQVDGVVAQRIPAPVPDVLTGGNGYGPHILLAVLNLQKLSLQVVQGLDAGSIEADFVRHGFDVCKALRVCKVTGGGHAVNAVAYLTALHIIAQLLLDALAVFVKQVVQRNDLAGVGTGGQRNHVNGQKVCILTGGEHQGGLLHIVCIRNEGQVYVAVELFLQDLVHLVFDHGDVGLILAGGHSDDV